MIRENTYSRCSLVDEKHVSLCETLDRVLNKGVVVGGEVIISVADVDLIYIGLQLLLTSVENVKRIRSDKTSQCHEETGVGL